MLVSGTGIPNDTTVLKINYPSIQTTCYLPTDYKIYLGFNGDLNDEINSTNSNATVNNNDYYFTLDQWNRLSAIHFTANSQISIPNNNITHPTGKKLSIFLWFKPDVLVSK
jgi:hypothetical protein